MTHSALTISSLTMPSLTMSPIHWQAQRQPNQLAVIAPAEIQLDNPQISYQQLSQLVSAAAETLAAQQLSAGDRLAVISANNLSMLVLYWACVDLGVLYFPINPKFPASQIAELCQHYQLKHYWAADGSQAACAKLPANTVEIQVDLEQLMAVDTPAAPRTLDPKAYSNAILTSGSTGLPKAAVHQLSQHFANAKGSASCIALNTNDRWLLSLPLFHIGGLAILHRCAFAGATVVIAQQQELATQLREQQITHLSLVATQLQRLLDQQPDSLQSVKALLLGGGAIPLNLLAQLEALIQRKKLAISAFTSYGMTEMCSQICTGLITADHSSGRLLPYRELEIRDQVIWLRGACLFSGYLTDNAIDPATDDQGWFCSKDRGYIDDTGQLHILGRSDNMFVCGGENIQPEEIESILKQQAEILEAICFAIEDREFTQLPAAVIKLSDLGRSKLSTGEIEQQELAVNGLLYQALEQKICEKIARFKRPRRYLLWSETSEQIGLKVNRKQVIAALASRL